MNNDYTQAELLEIIYAHAEWLRDPHTGERADFSGKHLRGVDLSCTNFRSANFTGANLQEADFSSADLRGAVLQKADLMQADLFGADLSDADLKGADFYNANLHGANLTGADLRGADFRGANLYIATGNILVVGPLGSQNRLTYAYSHDNLVYVRCGCFEGTLDAFAAKVKETHHGNEHEATYNAAIEFIRTIAKLRWGISSC